MGEVIQYGEGPGGKCQGICLLSYNCVPMCLRVCLCVGVVCIYFISSYTIYIYIYIQMYIDVCMCYRSAKVSVKKNWNWSWSQGKTEAKARRQPLWLPPWGPYRRRTFIRRACPTRCCTETPPRTTLPRNILHPPPLQTHKSPNSIQLLVFNSSQLVIIYNTPFFGVLKASVKCRGAAEPYYCSY